jgi:hypothetical protein
MTRYIYCTECKPKHKQIPGSRPTKKQKMYRGHERICAECGSTFLGTARAMTCSEACKKQRQKRQQRDHKQKASYQRKRAA